jgi:hypothetical protein
MYNRNPFYLYPNIPNGGRVVSHKKATKNKPPAWRLEIKSQGIDEYLGQITRDEIPGILSKMGVAFSPENPLCIKAKTIHDVLQSWCGAQQPKIFSVKRIRKPKSELFLLCEQIAKIVGGVLLVDLSPKIFEVLKFRIALKVEERRAQKMFVLLKQILCWQARNNYTFQKDFVPNKLWVRNPFRNPLSPSLLQELRRMYPETYLAMLLVDAFGLSQDELKALKFSHLEVSGENQGRFTIHKHTKSQEKRWVWVSRYMQECLLAWKEVGHINDNVFQSTLSGREQYLFGQIAEQESIPMTTLKYVRKTTSLRQKGKPSLHRRRRFSIAEIDALLEQLDLEDDTCLKLN